jgi:hypothetical protein
MRLRCTDAREHSGDTTIALHGAMMWVELEKSSLGIGGAREVMESWSDGVEGAP